MDLATLTKRALEIKAAYRQSNAAEGIPAWGVGDYLAGFVGDMGKLSKLIMAKRGLRAMEDVDSQLVHELCDCLWSVLVLADELGIDLSAEFMPAMDKLSARIPSVSS